MWIIKESVYPTESAGGLLLSSQKVKKEKEKKQNKKNLSGKIYVEIYWLITGGTDDTVNKVYTSRQKKEGYSFQPPRRRYTTTPLLYIFFPPLKLVNFISDPEEGRRGMCTPLTWPFSLI